MAGKTLKELLSKYTPPQEHAKLLELADNVLSRVDKEKRILEVRADFPYIVDKATIYEIERQVAEAYSLRFFKLLPRYKKELFSYGYVPQILIEAETVGTVAKGFFSEYTYELTEDKLRITLPFKEEGVNLLNDAKTPAVIENIIASEFGIRVRVELKYSDKVNTEQSEAARLRMEELDRQLAIAEREYELHLANDSFAKAPDAQQAEDTERLPRAASIYDYDLRECSVVDGKIKIGAMTFDVSSPTYAFGDEFEIRPVPIATINRAVKNIVFVGEVF